MRRIAPSGANLSPDVIKTLPDAAGAASSRRFLKMDFSGFRNLTGETARKNVTIVTHRLMTWLAVERPQSAKCCLLATTSSFPQSRHSRWRLSAFALLVVGLLLEFRGYRLLKKLMYLTPFRIGIVVLVVGLFVFMQAIKVA